MGAEGEGPTRAGSRIERSGWGGGTTGSRTRILAFGAAVIALVGVAVLVGTFGGWTGRPVSTGVRALPTLPTRTQPAPSRAVPPIDRSTPDTPNQVAAWVWLLLAAVVAVVVYLLLRRAWDARRRINERRRLQPEPVAETGPQMDDEAPPPVPQESAGRQFDARAAADAIVSCWVWVEEWAAARGNPRMSFETPTEFLDRVVVRVVVRVSVRVEEGPRESAAAIATGPGSAAPQSDPAQSDPALADPALADPVQADPARGDLTGQERAQHILAHGGPEQDATRRRTAAEVLLPLYQRARFDVGALDPESAVRARDAALTVCGKDPVEAV